MQEIGNDSTNPENYRGPKPKVPPEERPGFRVKRDTIARAERFVEYIMAGMDQVTAYRKAGYTAKTDAVAKQGAAKVLKRPEVVALMKKIGKEVISDIAVTTKRVIDELARVAFSDIRDYVDISKRNLKLTIDDTGEEVWEEVIELKVKPLSEMKNTAAIARVKQGRYGMEISLWDKTKSLEMLGKYLKLFGNDDISNRDKIEVDLSQLTDDELQMYYKLSNKVTTKLLEAPKSQYYQD